MPEALDIEFLNADPRCACTLLLDTSGSMSGEPISALNTGLQTFQTELQGDSLASRRVEVAIVTFGSGGVQTAQDFVTAAQFSAPQLQAGGDTPMGAAIHLALDMIKQRKATYKNNGVLYYRPWVFLITDGGPPTSGNLLRGGSRKRKLRKLFHSLRSVSPVPTCSGSPKSLLDLR
jgi:uncharacterized protein YegL